MLPALPSRRRVLLALGGGFAFLTPALAASAAEDQTPARPQNPQFRRYGVDQDVLAISTATGRHELFVKIVTDSGTAESWFRNKTRIQPDEGALYVVSVVRPISLSNKDVPFGSDILFVARDGKIVEIHPAITANSDRIFTANIPVKAALQLLGGSVMRLGIVPGDFVLHKIFGRTL